ncbi:hypothetical protein ALP87_02920 [Pseudomonas syringae pv. coriandricola]|nr:hypothetical protein ALP87_02920 [Pseudomonas syringae pv. coriandricola]
MLASASLRHEAISRSAQALITPVTPTTSAQVSVTTPIRLCRSSQRVRVDLLTRTWPNSSLRMNGEYSTVPETIATTNSSPMKASSSLPGNSAYMSTCRRSMTIMKPPLAEGISSASPVRASRAKVCDELGSVPAVAAVIAITPLGSSSSQPKYCMTSPGRWASAALASCSRFRCGVSAGISL